MRDRQTTTNDEQVKIELLSRWKLEAESRKNKCVLQVQTPELTVVKWSCILVLLVSHKSSLSLLLHHTSHYPTSN